MSRRSYPAKYHPELIPADPDNFYRGAKHVHGSQTQSNENGSGGIHYQINIDGLRSLESGRDNCRKVATAVVLRHMNPDLKFGRVSGELNQEAGAEQPSIGDMAAYLIGYGFKDLVVEIYDKGLPLRSRSMQETVKKGKVPDEVLHWFTRHSETSVDGWQRFVEQGGTFDAPAERPTVGLLHRALREPAGGPLLLMRSFSSKNNQPEVRPLHATVCVGHNWDEKRPFATIDSHITSEFDTYYRSFTTEQFVGSLGQAAGSGDIMVAFNLRGRDIDREVA